MLCISFLCHTFCVRLSYFGKAYVSCSCFNTLAKMGTIKQQSFVEAPEHHTFLQLFVVKIFDPPEARYQTGAPSFSPVCVVVEISGKPEARYQTGAPRFSPGLLLRALTRRRQHTKPEHQVFPQERFLRSLTCRRQDTEPEHVAASAFETKQTPSVSPGMFLRNFSRCQQI